ncbi:uncharacterized protein LOC130260420 isoform X7 [Oenanthe melanoleuca]|uniref:uncharacterized protein LOC130260420 isoform X7 n=1 Tax=Oenanthe melanoleuca TaxID=2939378 RepID=UPI0024C1D244|nr:uncharacterized protein LOC130260420 isoform X7 [Oenanthe melanoleuca]
MAAESSALKPPCRRFPSVFPQTHLACCPVPCSGEFVHQWSFQVLQQGLECRDCSCRAQRVTEGLCCSQGWSAGIAPAGSRGAQRVTSGSVLQPGLECRDCSCRAQRVTSGSVLQPGLECRDCSCRAQRDTEGHIRVCAAARVGVQGLLLQGAEGHIRVCAAARVGVQGLLLQGTEGHIRVCAAARVGVQGLLLQGAEGHRGSQRVCAAARVGVQGLLLQGAEGHIRVCAAATWDIPGVPLGGAVAGLRAAVRHLQQQHSTVQHSHLPHKGDFWGGQEQGEVSGAVLMVQLGRVATTEIRVMCKRQLGKEKINKKFFCFFG